VVRERERVTYSVGSLRNTNFNYWRICRLWNALSGWGISLLFNAVTHVEVWNTLYKIRQFLCQIQWQY
jgi:hypothetical protein